MSQPTPPATRPRPCTCGCKAITWSASEWRCMVCGTASTFLTEEESAATGGADLRVVQFTTPAPTP